MELKYNKILVLAPHSDDAELGCGATITRMIREGATVNVAVFSLAEEGSPGYGIRQLRDELNNSMSVLGINHFDVFGYQVREFPSKRQEILYHIDNLKREFNPDIVFIPSLNDLHQDHQTIAMEAVRVFKRSTILSYECPWNNLNFKSQVIIEVTDDDLSNKILALRSYRSQSDKHYFSDAFIAGLATMRGIQVNRKYAECFELIRLVV